MVWSLLCRKFGFKYSLFTYYKEKKNLNCHYKIDYMCEVRFKPTVRKKKLRMVKKQYIILNLLKIK